MENAVKLMYRSVYVDLEGMVFHDLESLNVAILESLEKFNARNLTRRRNPAVSCSILSRETV